MGYLFCTKPYFAGGAAGVWQPTKSMPFGTRFSSAFYAHNKIFVLTTNRNTVIYDLSGLSYEEITDTYRGVTLKRNGCFSLSKNKEIVYCLVGDGSTLYKKTRRLVCGITDEFSDKRFEYGLEDIQRFFCGDCGFHAHFGTYGKYLILLFGGRNELGEAIDDVCMVDPLNKGYWYKTKLSTPLMYLSTTKCSESYYSAGGINGSTVFSQLIKYTEQTNTVEYFDMPAALAGCCLVGHAGKVYVFGGATNANFTGVVNTVYAFDVVSKTWETLPPMPVAVANAGGCVLPDRNEIHIFGGWNGSTMLNTHQIFKLQ